MFKVGQKVVCIDTNWSKYICETYPIKGEIYTVRECYKHFTENRYLIYLEEIVNPPVFSVTVRNGSIGNHEPCFRAERFRAVDLEFGKMVCESLEVMTEPELV